MGLDYKYNFCPMFIVCAASLINGAETHEARNYSHLTPGSS